MYITCPAGALLAKCLAATCDRRIVNVSDLYRSTDDAVNIQGAAKKRPPIKLQFLRNGLALQYEIFYDYL